MSSKAPTIVQVLNPDTDGRVNKKINNYLGYYGDHSALRKMEAALLVDQYYELVTDFYEYGWSESFHFYKIRKGESRELSIVKHEYLVAHKLQLRPSDRILDIGCGIGGPARNIADLTGNNVVGLNINSYQIKRAKALTQVAKLEHLCEYVEGDYTKMTFDDNSFEKVYAIESVCHCAHMSKAYSEVYRVLKPGGLFVSYEWIGTDAYDPNNKMHKEIIDGILEGDGLPLLYTAKDVHHAIKTAGFELLEAKDLAQDSEVPWYSSLQWQWSISGFKSTTVGRLCTSAMLNVLETLRVSPRGSTKVHRMLCKGADNLVRGGQEGIFSPMYLVVMRKPLTTVG